jgi:hypothetical protein
MLEKIIRWLVKKLLPGSHIAKNPPKGRKNGTHKS